MAFLLWPRSLRNERTARTSCFMQATQTKVCASTPSSGDGVSRKLSLADVGIVLAVNPGDVEGSRGADVLLFPIVPNLDDCLYASVRRHFLDDPGDSGQDAALNYETRETRRCSPTSATSSTRRAPRKNMSMGSEQPSTIQAALSAQRSIKAGKSNRPIHHMVGGLTCCWSERVRKTPRTNSTISASVSCHEPDTGYFQLNPRSQA